MTTPSQMPESLKVVRDSLRNAAIEIAAANHYGWGNVCTDAADAIDALQAAIKDRDAEIERLKKDAERLDHLQSRLATVEVLPAGLAWKFQVGGFHGGASHNIRAAIDAAIDSMNGGANG